MPCKKKSKHKIKQFLAFSLPSPHHIRTAEAMLKKEKKTEKQTKNINPPTQP